MKFNTILLSSLLFLAPLAGCAEGNDGNTSTPVSQIFESGDILTLSSTTGASPSASYFSTRPADRPELAKRMLNILHKANASKSIISFAESRLMKHPRLKRDHFKVTLTDDDGTAYKFTYVSDPDSSLYVLNFIGAAKS